MRSGPSYLETPLSTETYASALASQRGPGVVESTTVLSGGGHAHRRVSWGAILGGVILVVAVQLLLSLLGAGIGLGTVNVNAGSEAIQTAKKAADTSAAAASKTSFAAFGVLPLDAIAAAIGGAIAFQQRTHVAPRFARQNL